METRLRQCCIFSDRWRRHAIVTAHERPVNGHLVWKNPYQQPVVNAGVQPVSKLLNERHLLLEDTSENWPFSVQIKLFIKRNNLTVHADRTKKKKTQQIENEHMEII